MKKKTEKNIRKKIFLDLILTAGLSVALLWLDLYSKIPESLMVAEDKKTELFQNVFPGWLEEAVVADNQLKSDIPLQNLKVTGKTTEAKNSYVVQCSLFGAIPVKKVKVEVVERENVMPCGTPVGIYLKTQGVLIVGTGEVCDVNGNSQSPGGDIVHSGDYILAVNDIPVSEKEEVVEQISKSIDGNVKLTVLRDSDIVDLQAPVVQTGTNEYKAGIWIRDDTQGIGTLTYIREDGKFGALGHGINDIDTSTLLTLEGGTIYDTEIHSIVKGINGMPGEVSGVIDYDGDHILGEITENSEIGIFGNVSADSLKNRYESMEVGYKQEIECGRATLLTEISGEPKEYEIQIERIHFNNDDVNKSMVIRVTDPELLETTGGIVRGMSGSPIIQNGRIVGAVTHVFVNDPTRGYGIFIEKMLDH